MRRGTSDANEEVFFDNERVRCGFFLTISPDGKYLACPNWKYDNSDGNGKQASEIAVISIEDPANIQFVKIAGSTPFQFSPDNKAIEYIAFSNDAWQIMMHNFNETTAKPIFQPLKDKIFNFAWSKDGKTLALSRGKQSQDAVLLSNID